MKQDPVELRHTLARRISRLRTGAGLSQAELGRRMQSAGFENWNQMTASRTEKAERDPSVFEVVALANIFGASFEAMIDFAADPAIAREAGLRHAITVLNRELAGGGS